MPLITPYNLLADRNIISYLKDINAGKAKPVETEWWLEMLKSGDFHINPLPSAFEGNTKTFPTLPEFTANYKEAVRVLREFIPAAKVIDYPDAIYPQVYGILSQINDRYQPAIEFLKQTAPLIRQAVAQRDLQKMEDKIFELAEILGVQRRSFPMLAVLSCLYESPKVVGAARQIIKPHKSGYSHEDAYNALADLRGLEIFAATLGLAGGSGKEALFALATGDKALAVFGCGLDIHEVTLGADGANINLNITATLFPALTEEERNRFKERLLAG